MRHSKTLSIGFGIAIGLAATVGLAAPALASNPSLGFYLSAPVVQNTFVSSPTLESFDSMTACSSASDWGISSSLQSVTSTGCSIRSADASGGATANSTSTAGSRPTGSGTKYLAIDPGKALTLAFNAPQKYLGFWWSSGDSGNVVKLYSGGTSGQLVGTFTASSIVSLIADGAYGQVSPIVGSSYRNCAYYGNPVTTSSPCGNVTMGSLEPSSYVNLIGSNGLTFDTVEFSELGGFGKFEIDNLAVSANDVTPDNSLVALPASIKTTMTTASLASSACMPFTKSFAWSVSNFSSDPVFTASPALPNGLTLDSATGEISGTPTDQLSNISQAETITATAGSQTATFSFQLNFSGCIVVSFDANGGNGSMADVNVAAPPYSSALPPNTFTRTGYTFKGWNDMQFQARAGRTTFADQANFSPSGPSSTVTLYAVWEANAGASLSGGASSSAGGGASSTNGGGASTQSGAASISASSLAMTGGPNVWPYLIAAVSVVMIGGVMLSARKFAQR